jgi:aminoglycoside phosphotransferase (APT) family kinase protein
MSAEPAEIRGPLGRWLAARLENVDAVEVGEFEKPTGGFSATTLLIPIRTWRAAEVRDEQIVLRMETPEPAIYPAQAPGLEVEVEVQFRTMQALRAHSKLPLAALVGYEADAGVLGAPFFVMDFVEGVVPRENPIYTQEGFFTEATPDQRRNMIEEGLRAMAEVHKVDWREAGFDWLLPARGEPGIAMQLDIWQGFTERELAGRDHADLKRTYAWLRENLPEDPSIGLNWGDARPGNIIWNDFRCACVTDFENVSLGPPELDLGWWLMFDRWSHETYGVDRLPGEPTRQEQRDYYASLLGRDLVACQYYELFGAARYAAIVVRVMNRLVERGDLASDHMLWLRNPAATCLEQMLAELD